MLNTRKLKIVLSVIQITSQASLIVKMLKGSVIIIYFTNKADKTKTMLKVKKIPEQLKF